MSGRVNRAWLGAPVIMLLWNLGLMSVPADGGPLSVPEFRAAGPLVAANSNPPMSGPGPGGVSLRPTFRWVELAPGVTTGFWICLEWWWAVVSMAGTFRQAGCRLKPGPGFLVP